MAVRYTKVSGKDRTFLPEEVRARLLGMKNWVYAALDEEEDIWCAYLVLAMVPGIRGTLQIHDLYVKPEYRDQMIGSRLLETAVSDAESVGVRRLFYKDIRPAIGQLWENQRFCEFNSFFMIRASESVDFYNADSIRENPRIERMKKQYAKLPIRTYASFSDVPVKKWLRKLGRANTIFDETSCDLEHTRFFTEGDEICGVAPVQIIRSFQAVLTGLYLEEEHENINPELARLMLRVHCIDSVLSAGCKKVFLISENDRDRKSVTELLGEPDGTQYVAEWVRQL